MFTRRKFHLQLILNFAYCIALLFIISFFVIIDSYKLFILTLIALDRNNY